MSGYIITRRRLHVRILLGILYMVAMVPHRKGISMDPIKLRKHELNSIVTAFLLYAVDVKDQHLHDHYMRIYDKLEHVNEDVIIIPAKGYIMID